MRKIKNREAEIPDFIMVANEGFNFNSSGTSESDHGGLSSREVKNSLFYRPMNRRFPEGVKAKAFARPVFNYYLTPFLLQATDKEGNQPDGEEWPSLYNYLSLD